MPNGLFGDLLVIDCASFIAGPVAATIMSDFGARVIKIEPPATGDSYRALIKHRPDDAHDYYWTLSSRNKESLALDLKNPSAREVLEALVRKADVFITNYPFPVRERLKLRAEDVLPLNKRLIYASLTPYGESGPERDRTAFDTTAWWARSGLMDMVRAPGVTEPGLSVPGMGDHPTAIAMYAAILTALYRRQMTGEGGAVSTSLLANGLWSNACQVQAQLCNVPLIPRGLRGERNPLTETYRSADGRLFNIVIVNHAREWPLLAAAVGHPEWIDDPRFATHESRFANARELTRLLDEIFATAPWAAWHERLDKSGVTYGIVAQVSDHPADPQIAANGLLPEFSDGAGLRTLDSPFHVDGEEKQIPRMAPAIGQHTRAILTELGMDVDGIAALLQ